MCLEGVCKCLKGVWRVSKGCLEGVLRVYVWYVGCLDISEGKVRTGKVKIGQVRTGQVQSGY